ncbi:hypothetical protein PVAND_016379 [Polypedilum vanderplanki]|uniref:Sodium/solute symporter n=1 Tax=Polypedilum vanderplanki TaxID=319348 RepID=A0A9J6BFR4_POLVA|nr:hypothetical protein PVAND_016379 [Polypedilum vanderplanki]
MSSSTLDVDTLSKSMQQMGTTDYAVFILMLVFSSLVGLYFGYQDHKMKKQNKRNGIEDDATNYLVGGRNMQVLPVSLSMIASFVSGVTILGTCTEVYLYGSQYSLFLIAIFFGTIISHFTIIPVIHHCKINSFYEYLEIRFNRELRIFGSCGFVISFTLFTPIVIYMPALAFNQMTGINVHIITSVSIFICVIYTSLGGIKAVVWTDVLQIIITFLTIALIAIKGTMIVGGLDIVLDRNLKGERIEPIDFNFDPTIRHSFWTLVIGGSIWWLSINGINQAMVQRYLSLKTMKKAQTANILFSFGAIIFIILSLYNGFLLYATYHDCDPLTTKLAQHPDQMFSLLAIETLKDFPGLVGIFVAGIFSAALSSASTGMNSISAVILLDFCGKMKLSKLQTSLILRGSVIIFGIISVLLVFVIEKLGAILQFAMIIPSSTSGPLLGIFLIGIFTPWIGGKSAFWSIIISSVIMTAIIVKAQIESLSGKIKIPLKPVSIDGCHYNFTFSSSPMATAEAIEEESKQIYHMSYLYYTVFGALLVIIISVLLSFIFGFQDARKIDKRLVAPFMRKFIQFENQEMKTKNLKIEEESLMEIYKLKNIEEKETCR